MPSLRALFFSSHCEERSDEAISGKESRDCRVLLSVVLAVTVNGVSLRALFSSSHCERSEAISSKEPRDCRVLPAVVLAVTVNGASLRGVKRRSNLAQRITRSLHYVRDDEEESRCHCARCFSVVIARSETTKQSRYHYAVIASEAKQSLPKNPETAASSLWSSSQ